MMQDNSFSQKRWLADVAQQLSQLLDQQRLPHGILFNGHPGSGTQDIAQWLAQQLLCTTNGLWGEACGQCKACSLLRAGNHPDLVHVAAEKAHIGVDSIRQANQFLIKKAQLGQAKVVIIEQAELMTEAAANALLKTLEEPTAYSVLLLTSHDSDRLLATIRSRCTLIDIRPPVGQQLKENVVASQLIDDYSNMSHLAQLQNEVVAQEFIDFETIFAQWLATPYFNEEFTELLTEQPKALAWLAQHFSAAMRFKNQWQGIRESVVSAELAKLSDECLQQCYTLLLMVSRQLKQLTQVNKSFVIESLVIDLQKLIGDNAKQGKADRK
ncbi:DNA polymerase III subunit delta' [Thalassotalea mangrovi]|uniref:DNA-directed DNA polymerase n=1 Tax=Thalassotalea mangrovi TaxID=2572245 RepID=A0A4V5NUC4_9GAMM|nr:DNA polymerase III subunit delta' [Thalassotalea mangrovi]TKB45894.1 DNA polymerase III subunit delta' [Thalassotalea mangrovi]